MIFILIFVLFIDLDDVIGEYSFIFLMLTLVVEFCMVFFYRTFFLGYLNKLLVVEIRLFRNILWNVLFRFFLMSFILGFLVNFFKYVLIFMKKLILKILLYYLLIDLYYL